MLTPDGKPAAGAQVLLLSQSRELPDFYSWFGLRPVETRVVLKAKCDEHGRFRLNATEQVTSRSQHLQLVVCATGYALAWRTLNFDEPQPDYELKLLPTKEFREKLTTPDGQPAVGIAVHINAIGFLEPVRDRALELQNLRDGGQVYPTVLTSDANGEVVVPQLPPGAAVWFTINQEPYAPFQRSWSPKSSAPHILALVPAHTITGVVRADDTGEPLAHAIVQSTIFRFPVDATRSTVTSETDDRGRFQLVTAPGQPGRGYSIEAYGPPDKPYLSHRLEFVWPKLPINQQEVEIRLMRGVLVRGKVIEEPGGQPVPGAQLYYTARPEPPEIAVASRDIGDPISVTDKAGSFSMAVPPGAGELIVLSSSVDHVLEEATVRQAQTTNRYRSYFFARLPLDLPADAEEKTVELKLRRGVTVAGTIVATDGTRPEQLTMLRPQPDSYGGYTDHYSVGPLRWQVNNGRLLLHGVPQDGDFPIALLDPSKKEGKRIVIHGRDANQPLKISLDKCGSASLHYLDSNGKPVAGFSPEVFVTQESMIEGGLAGEKLKPPCMRLSRFDAVNCASLMSDEKGHVTIPTVIPGCIYFVVDANGQADQELQIQAHAGEHLDIPDIVITVPQVIRQAEARWTAKQAAEAASK